MAKSLQDVKILLTRQQGQNNDLQEQITVLGGTAINFPLFAVESLVHEEWSKGIAQRLAEFNLAIMVSKNAAELCLANLPREVVGSLTWACVGQATARYLEAQSLHVAFYPKQPPFNSQTLVDELVSQSFALERAKVQIFTGADWDRGLSTLLRQKGAEVQVDIVYKRIQPKFAIPEIHRIFNANRTVDIILITCVTSLLHLQQLFCEYKIDKWDLPLLVVSQRIAQAALEMGFINVYTSESVLDTDIISSLIEMARGMHDGTYQHRH
jgi:uroporphyrinogen-III synthase